MRKESKDTQPVIRADQYHPEAGQAFAVENGIRRSPGEITSSVNPQHHRLGRFRRPLWRPYVEIQAVFAYTIAVLHASRSELRGIANAGPRFYLARLTPAQIAERRSSKRNTFEHRATA